MRKGLTLLTLTGAPFTVTSPARGCDVVWTQWCSAVGCTERVAVCEAPHCRDLWHCHWPLWHHCCHHPGVCLVAMCALVAPCSVLHTHTHTHSLSFSLSHSFTHTHTHTLLHSFTDSLTPRIFLSCDRRKASSLARTINHQCSNSHLFFLFFCFVCLVCFVAVVSFSSLLVLCP